MAHHVRAISVLHVMDISMFLYLIYHCGITWTGDLKLQQTQQHGQNIIVYYRVCRFSLMVHSNAVHTPHGLEAQFPQRTESAQYLPMTFNYHVSVCVIHARACLHVSTRHPAATFTRNTCTYNCVVFFAVYFLSLGGPTPRLELRCCCAAGCLLSATSCTGW